VAKKKVVVAVVSVLSKETFPTVGLALQLEVPMAAASIRSPKVGGGVLELRSAWPTGGGDSQYPSRGDDDQYPVGCGGGDHVKICPATRDPPHSITCVGSV
jgi:hypothetical protein